MPHVGIRIHSAGLNETRRDEGILRRLSLLNGRIWAAKTQHLGSRISQAGVMISLHDLYWHRGESEYIFLATQFKSYLLNLLSISYQAPFENQNEALNIAV